MKIVVTYQWALDPQEASVAADGKVDFSRAKAVVSDYDAVAIEVARGLATAAGATLVGVSVGGAAAAQAVATKAALSRGLDEALVVADADNAGTLNTAAVIAAAVQSLGDVALVVTGDASLDSGSKMLAATLGGTLGWATITDALGVAFDGSTLTAERVLPEGVQKVALAAPAVVAVASDAAKAKAPGMKDILAAGKKPVTVKSTADLGVALASEGTVTATAKLSGPARQQIAIDTKDPAAAAAQLVSALRAAGVLD